jgi:hypothetical protein
MILMAGTTASEFRLHELTQRFSHERQTRQQRRQHINPRRQRAVAIDGSSFARDQKTGTDHLLIRQFTNNNSWTAGRNSLGFRNGYIARSDCSGAQT